MPGLVDIMLSNINQRIKEQQKKFLPIIIYSSTTLHFVCNIRLGKNGDSPPMTWGQIENTPLILDLNEFPIGIVNYCEVHHLRKNKKTKFEKKKSQVFFLQFVVTLFCFVKKKKKILQDLLHFELPVSQKESN